MDVYEIPFVSVTDNEMINREGNLTKETALKHKVAKALVQHVYDIKKTGKMYYLLLSISTEERQQYPLPFRKFVVKTKDRINRCMLATYQNAWL